MSEKAPASPANLAPDPPQPHAHLGPFWHPRRGVGRLLAALAVGLAAYVATTVISAPHTAWYLRGVVGWDAFAATQLALTWSFILRATADQTRARAASEDPGRHLVWLLALSASTFSLFTAVFVLRHLKGMTQATSLCWGTLTVLAIVFAWFVTHTAYTLRYAHLYYRGKDKHHGGLAFPGDKPPEDIDFAYFAFTIGMCFQTSDVSISSRAIRRAVLVHALLSFVYNTTVVGLVLNLLLTFLN